MTTDERFDESISTWFEETAPARLPERVLDATFERTRRTRQHVGLGARLGRLRLTDPRVALGGAVAALLVVGFAINTTADRPAVGGPTAAPDPGAPFLGTWFSTSDADGGTQTMTVRSTATGALEVVVTDDVASVCSFGSSTMTGTGRLQGGNRLVIPAPVYTCDDGSEPQSLSGAPLDDLLRNLTYAYDADTGALTAGPESVWTREPGAVAIPRPAVSERSWPQSSLEEVRAAQARADAGDPDAAWQIDRRLTGQDWWDYIGRPKIAERFLREELGWDHALLLPFWQDYAPGGDDSGPADGVIRGLVYLRCGPGETNPLYPIPSRESTAGGHQCAPTIDELRYETVSLDLAQPDRRGPSGIWVVSRWEPATPFAQPDPRVLTEQATTRLTDFLEARIRGEGAEGYGVVRQGWNTSDEPPMLYAATTGAPYERFEIELDDGPGWPYGSMQFTVRLFADGGATVVEELVRAEVDGGNVALGYQPISATENGQPVSVRYTWFVGAVSVRAALPWAEYTFPWAEKTDVAMGLALAGDWGERFNLIGAPLPVGPGCEPGPAPADARALAAAIRADPDFEATAPVPVRVGGIGALAMDVTAVQGASVCGANPDPMVLQPDGDPDHAGFALREGSRMRLYLIDVPEGSSIDLLAIAIVAPEARFEQVIEAATPILESVEIPAR